MNEKYRRLINGRHEDNDFWPSLTDLLSSILLVVLLFFMGIVVSINNQISENEEKMAVQAAELEEKEKQIEMLTYIQKDIVEDLEKEFKKTNLDIAIDKETGAIKFSNDLLFDTEQATVRPEFKKQLEEFIPIYFYTLYNKYDEHIAEIVVEGHTDDVGSYMSNLDLSQRRAFSVVKYVLSDEFGDFPYKDLVKEDITANGRSESLLKHNKKGEVDRKQSRRVEFKFRLKNDYEGNEK